MNIRGVIRAAALLMGCAVILITPGAADGREVADVPARAEGVGPSARLVLRNVTIVDGTGAPAQGPYDLVIERDRIAEIRSIGSPGAINARRRASSGDLELDLTGHYVLPGFVDTHVHLHSSEDGQKVPAEYVLKLWLAHGVTSVRDVGSGHPIEWLADLRERSRRNEITGPRISVYPFFHDILNKPVNDPATARFAVREAKRRGADGIKFIGGAEDVLFAALDEAEVVGLRTTMHHAQQVVSYADVLDTSARGLDSMEHWYGLPEAMFTDRKLQAFPTDFVNNDEMMRFGEAGRLWKQTAEPGSERWNAVMNELLKRKFVLSPTFTAYLASRDLMRMSRASWHDEYTLPTLWDWYKPSRQAHGSYWFDWTTERETNWKENYAIWMRFVNEYKNKGGAVTVGSDSGFIYNLYGFGYVQELELLREAGFSPLEVIHSATQVGARAIGREADVGTVRVGRKADLVIVQGNPLANLKLLFGTGVLKLDDATGKVERRGGVRYTVKDGILYDAVQLRAQVRAMVAKQKADRGVAEGPMAIEDRDLSRCESAVRC